MSGWQLLAWSSTKGGVSVSNPSMQHTVPDRPPACRTKAVFVDTDRVPGTDSKVGDLVQNPVEAALIHQVRYLTLDTAAARLTAHAFSQLVGASIMCGIKPEDIGVITPYRQQIKVLTSLLRGHKGLEILTADKSQGRDKDFIIISMVRSNDVGNVSDPDTMEILFATC